MIRRELGYFFCALTYFSRLPAPAWVEHSPAALAASVRYLPAVGLLIGALGGGTAWLAAQLWPQPVAVLLAMAAMVYLTGALHEDGLADTVDGFGGGWDKARILAIMKDSRVGSFGVIALVLVLLGKWALLAALPLALLPWVVLAGQSWSRLCALGLMASLDYARPADDGAAKARPLAQRPSPGSLVLALLFGIAPLVMLPVAKVLLACFLGTMFCLWLARLSQRWLGGYTGDVLGAAQQGAECAFYLGLTANIIV